MSVEVIRYSRGQCALDVDGYQVPYIEVYEYPHGTKENPDPKPRFALTIMRTGGSPLLGFDVDTEEELLRWAPVLANAMAVAAGRTSHGPGSRPHNPHGTNWFFESDAGPFGTPIQEELVNS